MAEDIRKSGKCTTEGDPEAFFVPGAAQGPNKIFCFDCPVIAECLAEALDNRIESGIWGGMTERERKALLKRRPGVPSWRALFEATG